VPVRIATFEADIEEVAVDMALQFIALRNAAEGMSNEEAVKALENFGEMRKELVGFMIWADYRNEVVTVERGADYHRIKKLLAKLEED
jgi:hypothetical protein